MWCSRSVVSATTKVSPYRESLCCSTVNIFGMILLIAATQAGRMRYISTCSSQTKTYMER